MSYLSNLVSPKVIAAAAGAGAGATISGVLVWLIGAWGYRVGFGADVADAAVAAVPLQLVAFIGLVLTVAGAFIPGYQVTDPARDDSGQPPAADGGGDGLPLEGGENAEPADPQG